MTTLSMYETSTDQAKYMLPTTFAQERLWFLNQLEPQSPAYNIPATLRLNFSPDVAVLEQSINALIQRHEALRTTFVMLDGRPMQVVDPVLTVPLKIVDLHTLAETERKAEILRLATEELRQSFDLVKGPLLRATLLQVAPKEHILLFTIHHIVFDGWSIGVLYQELVTLYTAFAHGQSSPLPELPIQYADFAIWQQEWAQEEMLANQLTFWKQQLANAPTVLELPNDRPHSTTQTYHGSTYLFTLPKKLSEALKSLSRQEGVTLYMTLVAAFKTLLYRYTQQDDMVIGTVTSGRTQAETEALIGFFVNTLVLRTDLSGNPTYRELLGRVSKKFFETYTYQDVPFEYLVKELQPTRVLGRNPIFQVLLTLDPPLPDLPSGWTSLPMIAESGAAKFDISLRLEDRPQDLIGCLEYSTDLFDESTIVRMVTHWQTILESIVQNPDQHLLELPLLTDAERQQILVEWNDTATDYASDKCVHQLIEAQVEQTPNAIAVIFNGKQLTYQEMNAKANRLAHYLRQQGVGPDVLVGVCMERSMEMVVALLSVLKAGGAYVPLDPTYPQDRLAFMLHDAHVPILLTQSHLLDQLSHEDVQLICLDTEWDMPEQYENPVSNVQLDNLSYMIYTSGSTGKPKGVMNIHRGTCNRLHSIQEAHQLNSEDRVLQKTPFSFDVSVWEFFWPLFTGAALVVAKPGGHQDPLYMASLINEQKITALHFVPSMLQAFLAEPRSQQCSSLKYVFCGGEALSYELQERFYSCFDAQLYNLYGPTEASIDATSWHCQQKSDRRIVPIGRPIANTQTYILDSAMQPVPIGVSGELYVGGVGVARGYFNRPELTSAKFILDPFSQDAGAKLFKTGDLARYRVDGAIEFLGRIDHQVKVRGFRIELGEIEAIVDQHPAVREVVVVAREDTPGDKRLVAYVVLHEEDAVSGTELRNYAMKELPVYMVPSFVQLQAFPLLPNGKVDRRNLPMPSSTRTVEEETFIAPTLMSHYQLIQIWEELLETRPIGIRDDFFSLGGHSLLAAQMVNRIEQVFGKKLPLTALFAGPTIEHLAHVLDQQEEVPNLHTPYVALQTNGSEQPFFFLHGAYDGSAFYCIPLAHALGSEQPFYALHPYRFDNQLVPPTFEEIAATHVETLRTVQPNGPYLLGGFCGGGLVAYEVARQLQAQGDKVNFLVLMDPTPVAYLKTRRIIINRVGSLLRLSEERQLTCFLWSRHMYCYLQHVYRYTRFTRYRKLTYTHDSNQVYSKGGIILALKALHELWLSHGIEQTEQNEHTAARHKQHKLYTALSILRGLFPEPIFPTAERLRLDWGGMFHWTASNYQPNFYSGKSTFFFFRDSEIHHHDRIWRQIAKAKDKEVEIYRVPATHDSSKTVDLHKLANYLHMCLSKVQKGNNK